MFTFQENLICLICIIVFIKTSLRHSEFRFAPTRDTRSEFVKTKYFRDLLIVLYKKKQKKNRFAMQMKGQAKKKYQKHFTKNSIGRNN